ncbi:hypothetical protein OIU84_020266 [Salix udensis]|uniref:DUF4283 domain-containing protein n=1 Tax=Salix udensis TaxID=889485 RepID=A0AAD6J6I5_9ROSI|nr:hypothetical protein OIU84_020266 [Salix udensis]
MAPLTPTNTKVAPPEPLTAPANKSWAEKVSISDSSSRFSLDPLQRNLSSNQLLVSEDMLHHSSDIWTRTMVGFIPGFKMSHRMVNTIASRVWRSRGLEHVSTMANGFMIFRFQSENQMQEVLEQGPWIFGGKAIILQQWHPSYKFDKNKISKIPVWIRLHGLPFPLWSKMGLSHAASMVGRPLACDSQTYTCSRLEYARLCVEIDASLPKVTTFEVVSPLSPDPIVVEVQYEWLPPHCQACKLYGHSCKSQRPPMVKEPEKANMHHVVFPHPHTPNIFLPSTTVEPPENQNLASSKAPQNPNLLITTVASPPENPKSAPTISTPNTNLPSTSTSTVSMNKAVQHPTTTTIATSNQFQLLTRNPSLTKPDRQQTPIQPQKIQPQKAQPKAQPPILPQKTQLKKTQPLKLKETQPSLKKHLSPPSLDPVSDPDSDPEPLASPSTTLPEAQATILPEAQATNISPSIFSTNCTVSMMDSLGSQSTTSEDPKDNHEASSSSGTQPATHESPPDNWNTWGLNSPNKIWSVQNWIKSHHLDIIGLIETKVSISNLPRVESHLNLIGWDFFSNATLDSPCRILVGWNTQAYTLTNFHSSPQWITCDALSLKTQISAKLTFIYGHNNPSDRKPLWDYIVRTSPLYSNCPWILMGDFNAVLQPHNRSGGDSRWLGHHNDFHNATHQAQLFTLPFTGMSFTWTNGQRGDANIQKKLDWVMGNSCALETWPSVHSSFLPRSISDHCAAVLHLMPLGRSKPPPFKFLNFWTERDDYMQHIDTIWKEPVQGKPGPTLRSI